MRKPTHNQIYGNLKTFLKRVSYLCTNLNNLMDYFDVTVCLLILLMKAGGLQRLCQGFDRMQHQISRIRCDDEMHECKTGQGVTVRVRYVTINLCMTQFVYC